MSDERARVLARSGNVAVTHLEGRAFPGLHVQGDTFAELRRQVEHSARRLRASAQDSDALNDLEQTAEEMTDMLNFYETTIEHYGVKRPY